MLTARLGRRIETFLDRPESTAALEGVLLAIEQVRQMSVRAGELREEARASSLLDNQRLVTAVLLALLAGIGWAGAHIVVSSKNTVRALANAIVERDEQALALQRERDFATSLTDTAPAIILILGPDGAIEHVNPFLEQLTGWEHAHVRDRDWFATFVPERDRGRVRGLFHGAIQGPPIRGHVSAILTRVGDEREIEWHTQTQRDGEGRCVRLLAVGIDVTERIQAEAAIRRSLHEKETLLREIHHRVKNNLQIISSLLHFQAKKVHDAQAVAVFGEARERLRSMILVHDKLYNSRDLAAVEFAGYVRSLVDQFAHSAGVSGRIRFTVETAPVMLPIGAALPCGMVLVELLTNVIKYAFPGDRRGDALVRLGAADGRVSLTVGDNGVGLPAGFDPAETHSFGWQLIRNLTTQLNGVTTLVRESGTSVTLAFPHHPAS
jgi:PAS domain S-box-containing protein